MSPGIFPSFSIMNSILNTTASTNTVINYLNNTFSANAMANNASTESDEDAHHANFVWPEDDDVPVR